MQIQFYSLLKAKISCKLLINRFDICPVCPTETKQGSTNAALFAFIIAGIEVQMQQDILQHFFFALCRN